MECGKLFEMDPRQNIRAQGPWVTLIVVGEEIWYDRERTKEVCISIIQCHTAAAVLQSAVL